MFNPAADPVLEHALEGESQTLRAVLKIRELLMQGAFKPGERIREVPLSVKIAVSRTPLRLALDRLASALARIDPPRLSKTDPGILI